MGRETGQDEWSIQIKVNPTQVRDLLGHPVVYQGKGGRGKRGEAAPSVVGRGVNLLDGLSLESLSPRLLFLFAPPRRGERANNTVEIL